MAATSSSLNDCRIAGEQGSGQDHGRAHPAAQGRVEDLDAVEEFWA
jgi:hypothetical protein